MDRPSWRRSARDSEYGKRRDIYGSRGAASRAPFVPMGTARHVELSGRAGLGTGQAVLWLASP